MKKNNGKKWIAVAIAILLFVASGLVKSKSNEITEAESEKMAQKYLGSFDPFSSTANKNVIEGSDPSKKIAIISYEGAIGDGAVYDSVMEQFEEVKEDDAVKGVILKVNSPGGAVYNSEQIAERIKEIQKEKKIPVFTVMETMAASGGYYISAPTDRIYASNETLTGSIGVIMSSMSFEGLFEKYGIKQQNITTGKMKDAGSAGKDMTEEQKKYFQDLINSSFDRFVKVVSQGRSMKEDAVRKLADGRVYDGAQALDNGLVDKIGNLDTALADMKKEYKLDDPQVYEYSDEMSSFSRLFSKAESLIGKDSNSDLAILKQLMDKNSPVPMYYYGR